MILLAVVSGALIGWSGTSTLVLVRALDGAFYAGLFVYLASAGLDGWEHLRLERHVTGRFLAATVVPVGESLVHVGIAAALVTMLVLTRPPSGPVHGGDWIWTIAAFTFWVLGCADELVFHRRRALHREDILHTVSHLSAGFMLVMLAAREAVADAG